MQVPPDLLAADGLHIATRLVLTALWQMAAPDGLPFAAPSQRDLARAAGVSVAATRRAEVELLGVELIRRETRRIGGRPLGGWTLLRPPQALSLSAATLRCARKTVATVKPSRDREAGIRADIVQIVRWGQVDDSAAKLARRLEDSRAPCSTGRWYDMKVTRRVAVMADELKLREVGLPVGEVVIRYRAARPPEPVPFVWLCGKCKHTVADQGRTPARCPVCAAARLQHVNVSDLVAEVGSTEERPTRERRR